MAKQRTAKRNAAGTGSIRKKVVTRDGKEYTYWEARYSAGFSPGTGKQIQRSITGKTQKEVAQKLKAAMASIDNGTYLAPSKMTVAEWLDIWTEEYLGNTKPHTVLSYKSTIENHIKPAIGAIKLSNLTPEQVQRMINNLRSTKKTTLGSKVSPKTAKNIHGVLHSALTQAKRCGHIQNNPADNTILPKRQKAEISVLERNDLPAFYRAIAGDPYEDLYLFDLFTGLRQGELLGLQWADIDFQNKVIIVKRQLQYLGSAHGSYQYATPKNNKPRIISLPDKAAQALHRQKARQERMCLNAGSLWNNPDNLIFTNEVGEHLKHDVVYRHLKRILQDMGLPDFRFHDLRHSYAVLSLQSGCDIKTVQENLGHYAAAFTLDTYAHVTESMRRDAADKLDSFLPEIDEK